MGDLGAARKKQGGEQGWQSEEHALAVTVRRGWWHSPWLATMIDGLFQPGPGNGEGVGWAQWGGQGPRRGHCAPRGTMGLPPPSSPALLPVCPEGQLPRTPGSPPTPPPARTPPLSREGTLLHTHTHSQTHTLTLQILTSHTTPPSRHRQTGSIPDTEDTNSCHILMSPQGSESQIHKHRTTGPEMPGQSREPRGMALRPVTLYDNSL